jgi:uncharacterized protein (TIGR03437 family)
VNRQRKIFVAKSAVVLGVIPALILAHSNGPDPRKTGAPGDGLCSEAGCHTGTPNSGGGSVAIIFPGGMTYTPGQRQRLQVRVTDSTARVFGFQATARPASNERNGQAGTFTPADSSTFVLCEDGSPRSSSGSCRAQTPLEFIEHTLARNTNTYSFDWTPPATDIGNVRIYVAGNGGNANGQSDSGDHIYTANYTLTPAAASNRPTLRAGVGDPFRLSATVSNVSTNTWVELYGNNLSSATREWAGSDFNGNNAPTSLEGVKVTINNKPAFVRFVSPTQVNVQVPDIGTGPVTATIENANGTSEPISLNAQAATPSLLIHPLFVSEGRQYLVALHDANTFVGRAGLVQGVNFRPAKPNDVILAFGIGFGATNPANAPGVIVGSPASLAMSFGLTFGTTPATVDFAGLASGAIGLYQFNIRVPDVPDGDQPINVTLGGTPINQTLFLTVQR